MNNPIYNDTFQGKWKELKGEIQSTWAKLTNEELEETKGNIKSIGGLIQQKYGHAKDEVSSKLDDIVNRISSKAHAAKEEATHLTAKGTDAAKNTIRKN